jgi:endonuclease/exonuclease/phosphatase family metal-dependent hydrolase
VRLATSRFVVLPAWLASVIVLVIACGRTAPTSIPSITSATPPVFAPAIRLPAAEPHTVRVASYNVNFGLAGDPLSERLAIDALASLGADVVLLQETNPRWEKALVDGLDFAHHAFVPPDELPAGGMGILSRHPIVTSETLPSVAGPFFAWRIVVDTPRGRLQLLNVHLRPPMSDGGSWVVGFFTTREDRERELAWHVAALDPTLPTVIAGDLNEAADGLAIRHAAAHGYEDAIARFAGSRPTWRWPLRGLGSRWELRFQLDHILHDRRLVATAAGIVDRGRSDHFPVWADLVRAE